MLRRPHAHHRGLRARLPAAAPTFGDSRRHQNRHLMITATRLRQRRADLRSPWSSSVAMTLTQMRRAGVKMNLQWTRSAATSPVNTSLCLPPHPPSLALGPIATRRTYLPPHSNPHSRVRGTFRAPSPAGSFLGGFRTPATAHWARSFTAGIRNPQQSRKSAGPTGKSALPSRTEVLSRVSQVRKVPIGAVWTTG